MEKRALLAVVISIAILLLWDIFYVKPHTPEKSVKKQVEVVQSKTSDTIVPAATYPEQKTTAPETKQETIVLKTPLYSATFGTNGAKLISLKLNQYKDKLGENGKPVEMIQSSLPSLSLQGGFSDKNCQYVPSAHGTIEVNDNPYDLAFTSGVAQGLVFRRIYTIDPESYLIKCRSVVQNNTEEAMDLAMSLDIEGSYPIEDKKSRYTFEGPVLLNGKHLEEFKLSTIKESGLFRNFEGPVKWFGFEDKYFLKTAIPAGAPNATVSIKRIDENIVSVSYDIPRSIVNPGQITTQDFSLFLGPKELKTLKTSGNELIKALDFGFFDFIAKPLLISMNWINNYVKIYGLAIIILTIIVKIVLYPLTLTSFKSMKELQKIQPLMKEIQATHKDDRAKMNQELMRIYKEHKINPMGGCLPMLLQIPILFALYKVFLSAIELRHTPFHIFGTWLPDLSAKDPYYITPVLMGLSWVIQQKLTPTTGDPMQQKMMLIMPVVFTVMFLNFPSGLVLYWLVSNILSIAQQVYINRVHT
jgi:YidC/Oxa1 family membrane protein insertase